jgi:excinuclease UvrABC nuclease subunit
VKIADIRPSFQLKASFDLYSLNRITDCSGCYCLTNAGGDILYVGQAISIRQRLIQHFESEKRDAHTQYGRISVAWWMQMNTAKLNALERGLIEAVCLSDGQLPPLNRKSGPI